MLNIEIKAKTDDHARFREILKSEGADFIGRDHQVDTYFHVKNGRLKLREGTIENNLIWYKREDRKGPKQSDVHLYRPASVHVMKEVLEKALGVLVIVDKVREIYFIDNVKFHIDTVKGLGSFVEIEAIDRDGVTGEVTLREQCDKYIDLFGIGDSDLISVSYSDLLLKGQQLPGKRDK